MSASPLRRAADRLEEVTAPALLVTGDLDMPDVLRVVAEAHRRMPRAERAEFPGVGHMVNMERQEVFDRVLLAHLHGLS